MVGFGQQMSRARDWLRGRGDWPHPLAEKILLNSLRRGETRMKRVGQLARTWQRSPIRRVLRGSGLLHMTGLDRTERAMPQFTSPSEFLETYPAREAKKGRVALFKGCLQDQTDPDTLPAAINLLNALGYEVSVPSSQSCCGGLHLHSGEHDEAEKLAHNNVNAFSGSRYIVGVASGCGAVIKQYEQLLGRAGEATASAYRDIATFLTENDALGETEFSPLPARALVHEPCSHRNQLKQSKLVYELLRNIPELEVEPLPDNEFCCGGAGSYSISEPDLAKRMREPKLDALANLRPDYLVTTNIGCALHLKAGLAERDIQVEILHPVTLLARQLLVSESNIDPACLNPQTADMV